MATGTVKWFSDDKGFGFITPTIRATPVRCTTLASPANGYKSLAEGAKVEYDGGAGPQGPERVERPRHLRYAAPRRRRPRPPATPRVTLTAWTEEETGGSRFA